MQKIKLWLELQIVLILKGLNKVRIPIAQQIKLINDSIHLATRYVPRDFGEIIQLQGTKTATQDFTNKCYGRIQKRIIEALDDNFPRIPVILASQTVPKDAEYFFCIEPLSGVDNFQRSLPLFAITVALFKQENDLIEPVLMSVHNPILQEVFYAGKGIGAWFENFKETAVPKSRMRVSNKADFADAIISSPFNVAFQINRLFGSHLLEMAYLAAGRIDVLIQKTESLLTQAGMMMVREAGGYVEEKGKLCLASNSLLSRVAISALSSLESN
jgi:myo-inositol-1(or 4)-monophosphatase